MIQSLCVGLFSEPLDISQSNTKNLRYHVVPKRLAGVSPEVNLNNPPCAGDKAC